MEATKTVEKASVFRIYPNVKQTQQINKTVGCARFVYNYFLDKRIKAYQEDGTRLGHNKCSTLLTRLKRDKDHLWLQEVDKFALQNSLRDLNTAYNNFFREIAKGNKKQGFPKFKSKHKSKEKYRTNFTNGNICIDLEARQIKLPKLGWIKLRMGKKTKTLGAIINATINKTSAGKYFVSVLHQVEIRELPENMNYTGYDLGLNTYAIGSNNDLIENPRYLRQEAKKLVMLQRQLARMKKGSSNYKKQKIKIARQHERVANMRKDFLHQQSTKIVRENQVICLEDLQVKNMVKNHKLAKSISDAAWGMFRQMLLYKANWYGRTVVIIDKFYPSSKLCHVCGEINPMLTLSIREWQCPKCKTILDRDQNAAKNILAEGIRLLSA
jgi:putative transposase